MSLVEKFDKKCGVYALVNRENGRMYIGSSKNFYNRMRTHKSNLTLNNHYSTELQRDYNAGHNIKFIIIEECKRSELLDLENHFINFFQDFAYNYVMNPSKKKKKRKRKNLDETEIYFQNGRTTPAPTKQVKPEDVLRRFRNAKEKTPPRTTKGKAPVHQVCTRTGKILNTYPSLSSAAKSVGTCRQNIYKAVKFTGSTACGFWWERA